MKKKGRKPKMESKIILLVTTLSNLLTFLLTSYFTRKEKKHDIEVKMLLQYQELTEKYLELNKKYITLSEKLDRYEKENNDLKSEIEKLKKAA